MSTYAVIGGTGTVGRHIVTGLRERGHEVRALHRGASDYPVDLRDGTGLEAALAGCEILVDASNGPANRPESVIVDGFRRAVNAAAAAGVGHLVCVSIVGIEDVPGRYYRAKVAQEQIVRDRDLPWTIVRSTQFHELVERALVACARWRISPRSGARLQPVAAAEAGAAIAAVAAAPDAGRTVTVGGPEVLDVSTLARQWSAARGRRGVPLALPMPPRVGRPLRAGALTCPSPDVQGSVSFASWARPPSRDT